MDWLAAFPGILDTAVTWRLVQPAAALGFRPARQRMLDAVDEEGLAI